MFCRQCGNEISNEAKFCNFCGTKTVAPKARKGESDNCLDAYKPAGGKSDTSTNEKPAIPLPDCTEANRESSGANEKDDENGEAHRGCDTSKQTAEGTANALEASNLKAAVAQNKKRSRRHMPMILLVALALALATSVAYAAYRVYNDVWLPYQAEQAARTTSASNSAGSDGDTITGKTTGEPENLLHIADILAMEPTEIPSYIEAQGITPQQIAPSKYALDGGFRSDRAFDAWVLIQDETNSIVTAQDSKGEYLDPDYYNQTYTSIPPVLSVGDAAVPFEGINQSYFTAENLESGSSPSSIVLTSISLNSLSGEAFDSFLEYCGLGKPLASIEATQKGVLISAAKTGILENQKGEKYLWYALGQIDKNGKYSSCTIGCMKVDVAFSTLGASTSASASSSDPKGYWNDADNTTKSKLIAKSILEHEYQSYSSINIKE